MTIDPSVERLEVLESFILSIVTPVHAYDPWFGCEKSLADYVVDVRHELPEDFDSLSASDLLSAAREGINHVIRSGRLASGRYACEQGKVYALVSALEAPVYRSRPDWYFIRTDELD